MQNCKLPFKTAFDNSRVFLQDMEIIDDNFKILNDVEFDKVILELEKDSNQTYKVKGKPWIRDIVRGGEYAEPNLKVLNEIDQKRKDLGLYEDQLSAEVPNQINEPDTIISRNQRVSPLISFIGNKAREKTITASNSAKLSDIFSDSKKMVWGTLSNNPTTGYDFEKSSQLSSDTIESYSSLHKGLSGISIQSVFDKNFSKVEREYKTLSFIVEGLYSDSFNGKLFDFIKSKLGDVQIRVTNSINKPMFVYDGNLYINPEQLASQIKTDQLPNVEEYLNTVVGEELVHLIFHKQLSNNDYKIVGKYLEDNPSILNRVIDLYKFDSPLNGRQVVDEYLRMLVQDKVFGTTTELVRTAELPQFKKWFTDLWNFIRDFFKKEYPSEIKTIVDPAIKFIEDSQQEFYQLADEKPYEVTPELKSTLEQFVKKINPDFKIEVLDTLISKKGVNVSGIAKISEFVIQLQRGKETALPEEVAHFLIELLDNDSALKKTMKDEITRTRLYKNLRQNPGYKKVFGNDLDGFKREAMAKLVALYLTDKESFKYQVGSDSVYENIVRWIKDFFRWIKGQTNSIASFIEAADKIVNLDTSGLLLSQGRYVEEMYSMGDFITSSTTLTTVGNVNTKKYDRVLINLSDTVFDTNGYFGVGSKKADVLLGGDSPELVSFYNDVELTSLGRELQDKMGNGAIENITFYTSMSHHPALQQRLESLFGLNVDVKYLNKPGTIENEFGRVLMEVQSNTLPELVREYGTMKTILIDNQPVKVGFDVESKLYRQSKANIYESFIEILKDREKKQAIKEKMDSFLEELATLDKGSVTLKIKEGFNIIRNNYGDVERLEERLSKEEVDESYDSLFREEGALLLPIAQAKKGKKLLDKMNQYENAVLTFFGTLESVTNFFKDRNEADYQQIKDRLAKGTEKEIDMAIKELALVNKMGQKWEGFIKDLTNLIAGVPKTEAISKVLGDLGQQIALSKVKGRNLAVHIIGAKLTPALESYNSHRHSELNEMLDRLSKVSESEKPAIEAKIKILKKDQNEDGSFLNAGDIIDILNGEGKDMTPLTVWLKPLANSSDLIVGPLVKLLKKAQVEVETKEVVAAQQLGFFIQQEEKKAGITEKDWNNRIVYVDDIYISEMVDGKSMKVKKPALTLLHQFKNEYRRDEEYLKVKAKKDKWIEARDAGLPTEELLKDFIAEKNRFQQWLNIHWNQEYSQAYYERYKDIQTPENEILFEKISEEQGELYDKIEELSIRSQNEEGTTKKETNKEIERLRAEIKGMRRDTYLNGSPKVGEDLEKAKLLQKRLEIDREFFEYKLDIPTFRRDFLVFLKSQNVDSEIFANIELKLKEDNLTDLYKYVKKNNLKKTLEWLDDNTVLKYHKDWYEKRKVLSEEISDISDQISAITGNPYKSSLTELWGELFNLTSYLRDEDNIFDGSSASPVIQAKVKEYEEEIERIKRLTRELPKVVSPELKALKARLKEKIEILSSLQRKRITETYKDTFNELMSQTNFREVYNANGNNIYGEGINLIDFINSPEFKQSLKDNPNHDFVKWYNDNHVTRMYFEDGVEIQGESPTYIWLQIEPTDKDYVLTVPSSRYSTRVVQKKHHTVKDENNYNQSLKRWNPKSAEFMNPEYKKLMLSTNPKEQAIFKILKAIEAHHLSTQFDTKVTEGKLGYTLPYIKRQMHEEGYIKTMKREFFDQTNRFEEGEGNFQETGKKSSLSKTKEKIINWWKNVETETEAEDKTELQKIMRVAVPYTKYQEPDNVSKDVLLSVIRYSASTRQADKMLDFLPFMNLVEDSLINTPKVDKLGRPINVQKERIAALQFAKENLIFGINNQFELGTGIENFARSIRKINTYGSLVFNVANVVKNNLQGRLQNLIGASFGDWSTNKSMAKASSNFKTNLAWFISQGEKPLDQRDIHFHILSYFNPEMDSNIYDNLIKGSTKRNVASSNIMMFNRAMEFSIVSNMIFARLYHVKVKGKDGDVKELFDVLEKRNGRLTVKEGYTEIKTGRPINDEYLLDTKLAYSTVVEYVQGRVSAKTKLSTTTIGQALLYFKNWLTPMLRRRFDSKEANYMIGEDLEGYWRVFMKMSINMFRDIVTTHQLNWHSYTPSEQRDFNTTLKEIGVMMATLGILGLGFGFDADDPDRFKKLKKKSAYENYAILLLLQAKNETEALSLMPFVNTETSLVPPIFTEGAKFLTNPTIGLAMIQNSLKTMNLLGELVVGSETAYYDRNMPQFGIEKGDVKAFRYLTKVVQLDDFILLDDPEQKLRTVIGNMNR